MDRKRIVKTLLFTPGLKHRWGLPSIFTGKPGTGKTSCYESYTHAFGLAIETVIASLREPADFAGLPIVTGDGIRLAPPLWAQTLAKAVRGVAFFDEINTAPPSVQAALLRVSLEGRVGDLQLPPTVRFAAAMNATEDAAGGWDLTPPLANRFGHFSWEPPSVDEWSVWLLGASDEIGVQASAEAEEKRVLDIWPNPFAKAKGLVAGFLKRRPSLQLAMPQAGSPDASRAWPSPRSWEMVVRGLAGAEVHGLSEIDRDEILSAFVGSAAANEFITYVVEADLPDPEELLDGKIKWAHEAKRLDRTVAVLGACSAIVAPAKAVRRKERAAALWKLMEGVLKDADCLFAPAQVLVKSGLAAIPEARTTLAKIQPILASAGVEP